ncbi:MAG: hypothetical protein HC809_15430 [Gammaproteobacteria bacterium]|nr:hypothetical protein [Gammaproteobacteria bacterium]
MSLSERVSNLVSELAGLNRDAAGQWISIQRTGLEGVVKAHRDRFAALQQVKGLQDLVEAERAFLAELNETAVNQFKANVELAQTSFSRMQSMARGQSPATA